MKQKRLRVPHAKPGELLARWGKEEPGRGHGADIVYAWGDGCDRSDPRCLAAALGDRRRYDMGPERSLFELLEARGYDITTLRFSIQKKAAGDSP